MTALTLDPRTQVMDVADPSPTVSVQWDRALQAAITEDESGPTIASRSIAMVHTAIYDAWAAGDDTADGVHFEDDVDWSEKRIGEAMSHAAHATLSALFPEQAERFDDKVRELGLEPGADTEEGELGRAVAEALLAARMEDGANQANGYAAPTDEHGDPIYSVVNGGPGSMVDIERWTPENVPIDPEDVDPEQTFLTPQWGSVTPFGLDTGDQHRPEAPEPFFLIEGASLDMYGAVVTLPDGSTVPLGRDLVGTVINPAFIAQAERVVEASAELTDEHKLIAEFWEDGAGTSFPPGNAMIQAQFVSAREDHSQAEDAAFFMAMGNAQLDAGIAAWDAKKHFDYARPVRVIRELGRLGLIGTPGVDELTGEQGNVIQAWGGPDLGTRTILAENWLPYQPPGGDPSPPFAEYVSGHSTFSAAGAEILRLFSRSDVFGGAVTFRPGESRFEDTTPTDELTLRWDTFTEAADQSGISRIYGGIHFDDGNENGLALGRAVARETFEAALGFMQGIGDGAGDDRIRGSEDDDILAGLGGNDTITTGDGRDGIAFMAGHGHDRVTDFDVNGRWARNREDGGRRADGGERDFDTLMLSGLGDLDGEYATAAELRDLVRAIGRDGDDATDAVVMGRDLLLDFGTAGSITLEGVVGKLGGRQSLYAIGAENGRTRGTEGDDRLKGTRGDATYDGGAGDDVIRTGRGRDTVVMRPGGGHDVVRDFDVRRGAERSFDTLELAGFGALDGRYDSAADLRALVRAIDRDGNDATRAEIGRRHLTLTFADGSAITLRNVADDLRRRRSC